MDYQGLDVAPPKLIIENNLLFKKFNPSKFNLSALFSIKLLYYKPMFLIQILHQNSKLSFRHSNINMYTCNTYLHRRIKSIKISQNKQDMKLEHTEVRSLAKGIIIRMVNKVFEQIIKIIKILESTVKHHYARQPVSYTHLTLPTIYSV